MANPKGSRSRSTPMTTARAAKRFKAAVLELLQASRPEPANSRAMRQERCWRPRRWKYLPWEQSYMLRIRPLPV